MDIKSNIIKQQNNVHQSVGQPKSLLTKAPIVKTIIAKAVNVSKLENNTLISVGKYGFALAGDAKLNYYQILLYGSKSLVLLNLIVTKGFKYKVNENNTVEFQSKDNWYLEFMNTNDAIDFNKQLAFVMWRLNGTKELFWMDLYYSTRYNKLATFGSTVEITYFANTVQGKTLGPEVSNNINDNQYLKVNVNEEGWERSLLGTNENNVRIVCIPIAEMGAWKILTNGHQCLCLTMTVKNVYEYKENYILTDLPVMNKEQETLDKTIKNDCNLRGNLIQSKEIVNVNVSTDIVPPTKICSIELLYEEFEKLKIHNEKTNERLTVLEALVKDKKSEENDNSEFKKSMKIVYKNILREFPVDQTFSGNQIHTIIKDIFYNTIMSSNYSQNT